MHNNSLGAAVRAARDRILAAPVAAHTKVHEHELSKGGEVTGLELEKAARLRVVSDPRLAWQRCVEPDRVPGGGVVVVLVVLGVLVVLVGVVGVVGVAVGCRRIGRDGEVVV